MNADATAADLTRLKEFLDPKSSEANGWHAVTVTLDDPEELHGRAAVAAAIAGLDRGDAWMCLTDRVVYRTGADWQAVFDGPDPDPFDTPPLTAEFAAGAGIGVSLRHVHGELWRKVTIREGVPGAAAGVPVLARDWRLVSVIAGTLLHYRVYWRAEGGDWPQYRPFAQRFCGFVQDED